MINQKLIDAYKFRRRGFNAFHALEMARMDISRGTIRYPGTGRGAMRGGEAFPLRRAQGYRYVSQLVFWCERPADHMRLVGFADQIVKSIGHTGWYNDEGGDNGERIRGVVYQLPTHKGKQRFMYGFADPCNDGPACLALELADDKEDAARWADSVAETYAEDSREYNEAWQAGARYADLAEQIATMRQSALELLAERRAIKRDFPALDAPNACAALVREIKSIWRDIRDHRQERAKLFDTYGATQAFNDH